jgi:hypothetical protein
LKHHFLKAEYIAQLSTDAVQEATAATSYKQGKNNGPEENEGMKETSC